MSSLEQFKKLLNQGSEPSFFVRDMQELVNTLNDPDRKNYVPSKFQENPMLFQLFVTPQKASTTFLKYDTLNRPIFAISSLNTNKPENCALSSASSSSSHDIWNKIPLGSTFSFTLLENEIQIATTGTVIKIEKDKLHVRCTNLNHKFCKATQARQCEFQIIDDSLNDSKIQEMAMELALSFQTPSCGNGHIIRLIYSDTHDKQQPFSPAFDNRPLHVILSKKKNACEKSHKTNYSHVNQEPSQKQPKKNLHWRSWLDEDLTYVNEKAPSLNEGQALAIILALRSKHFCCIQGPPGTGKTSTMVVLLKLLESAGFSVLVSSSSNKAVDNIFDVACEQGIRCINFKPKGVRTTNLATATVVQENSNCFTSTDVSIIFATCAACYSLYTLDFLSGKKISFDIAILDEAAQISQIESWIPCLLSKRFIFVGDHKQLGPCVNEFYNYYLSISLFEHIYNKWGSTVSHQLSIQYRMNDHILKWSSLNFYESKLVSHDSNKRRSIVDILSRKSLSCPPSYNPLLWIDTSDHADNMESYFPFNQTSPYNKYEAYIVLLLIKLYSKCISTPLCAHLVVILPYMGQVVFLQKKIQEKFPESMHPLVSTVDSFQGGENDIVIISLVRCNPSNFIGFLKCYNRLNVAITRAKRQVVIVGNPSMLKSDEVLWNLFTTFEIHGEVIPSVYLTKALRKRSNKSLLNQQSS